LQAETELLRYQLSNWGIETFTLSPDSKTVAASSGDMLYLWEWQAGQEARKIKLPERSYAGGLAFSPDGKMLAVGGGSLREIYVWDVASGRLRRRLARPGDYGRMMQMAFSPDGK